MVFLVKTQILILLIAINSIYKIHHTILVLYTIIVENVVCMCVSVYSVCTWQALL